VTADDAVRAAQQIGIAEGDCIIVQSDGQILHPHTSASGASHVDGWRVCNQGGTYVAVEKVHSV
jgi:hypothetical protein